MKGRFFNRKLAVPASLAGLLIWALLSLNSAHALEGKALKIHTEILRKVPIYDDPELNKYVNDLAKKLTPESSRFRDQYQVFILDSPEVNAYTIGYGLIYFNRGLISLLTTEGQLAAVLAHEIGHNEARHISRGKTNQTLGNIGEFLASVLTGNSNVGGALDLANREREQGFRRELELEADELAAKYLYANGYAPDEMISSLEVLEKNVLLMDKIQESNMARYHGVFDGHPSTDRRLRELVQQAGVLPPGEAFRGRAEMRAKLEGVVFGPNYDGNKRADQERYTNKSLGITFVYPKEWSRELKGNKIILKDAEKTIQLKITTEKTKDKSLTSQQALEKEYPDDLSAVQKIDEKATKDLGTVARRPQQRVAVIQVGRNTFHFQGIARNNQLSEDQDKQMLEVITSFRRATRDDLSPKESRKIYFKRLEPGESFASLAKDGVLGKYTEDFLRVMNGYYPRGEPEPGTYVKLVKKPDPEE
jgi:predicted Zn-dependent protease